MAKTQWHRVLRGGAMRRQAPDIAAAEDDLRVADPRRRQLVSITWDEQI